MLEQYNFLGYSYRLVPVLRTSINSILEVYPQPCMLFGTACFFGDAFKSHTIKYFAISILYLR